MGEEVKDFSVTFESNSEISKNLALTIEIK